MKKVTFKRQGSADVLYLKAASVFVEYHHLSGSYCIMMDNGKCWSYVDRGITQHKGENPLPAVPEIESVIYTRTGQFVPINAEYIEAYRITSDKPLYSYTAYDKQFFKGVCIDGLTVVEVKEKVDFDFLKDFEYYKVDLIIDLLEANTSSLQNMKFNEFVTLLHDNHYMQNYRAIVEARIC